MSDISGYFYLTRDNFSLEVKFHLPMDGITVIYGHSGAGKTTLLRCMAGLERPQQGFLSVNGQCWYDSRSNVSLLTHQRPIGYVFQDAHLFPHLSVKNNLLYAYRRRKMTQHYFSDQQIIEWLQLGSLLNRRVVNLSGGERQKIAIGRALLKSPDLLLMDEPISSLDPKSKRDIIAFLRLIRQKTAIPIIYVTHSLEELLQLGDFVMQMEYGKVTMNGRLAELRSGILNSFVENF